jgi:hypothetical protein
MTGIIRPAGLILACGLFSGLASPSPIHAQRALLEVAPNAAPDGPRLMQVNDDGGLVVRAGVTPGGIPASGTGYRMMWYPKKYAFRSGYTEAEWDDANIGAGSVAMGSNTLASGANSTAFGAETKATSQHATALGERTIASGIATVAAGTASTASGGTSVAMGALTQASGESSVALGDRTKASGNNSTALGELSVASGLTATAIGSGTTASGFASFATGGGTKALGRNSTAMGEATTAVGDFSTAMGRLAATFGPGGFAYGDNSAGTTITALSNEFAIRAAGGFRLRTSGNLSTGCDLAAGSGTFSCTSSRLAKENFEDLDGEVVLDKLAAMPIQRWRYRNTEDWHVGPAAEDFHAAFQLGPGPTTISTVDADGIGLLAAQALERRTAELKEENAALRAELAALRSLVDRLAASTRGR